MLPFGSHQAPLQSIARSSLLRGSQVEGVLSPLSAVLGFVILLHLLLLLLFITQELLGFRFGVEGLGFGVSGLGVRV